MGFKNAEPTHKLNANLGYAAGPWEGELYGSYTSATKGMVITPGTSPASPATAAILPIKAYTTLSPRLGWHANDHVLIELVAENLWPYQDTVLQKMETSYFLSVKVSY